MACIQVVVCKISGNNNVPEYKDSVYNVFESYMEMRGRMPPKTCFLHSHLDSLLEKCRAESNEQDESFRQDIMLMQTRHVGIKT